MYHEKLKRFDAVSKSNCALLTSACMMRIEVLHFIRWIELVLESGIQESRFFSKCTRNF